MPYYYTPRYNIEAAKARISSDNAVAETALSSYLKKANFGAQAEQTPQAVEMPKPVEEEPKEEVSTWRRIGETLGDFFKNILVGAQKAIEGIIDFGSSTIGVIAGWAGNDALKQKMTDFTSRDLTNEWYDHLKNDYGIDTSFSHSFINDMSETGQRIIRGVSQGIGQMLPAVLTAGVGGAITGSLSAAGKIAATTANLITKGIRAANLIGLGISAAGNSTQEALNTEIIDENGEVKHPTLDRAYLYGLASGAVEIATETLVGGGYEKLFGAGVADKLINKLAKSATFSRAAQFAFNAIGEGVEEVASEAVSNTLKTIYNSKDGKVHWESPDVMEMFESGVIGTLTAAAMGGAQAVIRRASNVATVQDTMVEIENQQKTVDDLAAEGKYEGDVAQNLENRLNENLETLSKRFQKASPKAREKMLRNNPNILDYLNEDGTIKRDSLKEGVEEIAPEQARGVMSPSLITRRNEIANTLAEHGTRIATELDDTQRQNLQRLQTVLKNSGVKKGTSLKIVVSEQMSDANAFVNGDYMVISKERLNDTASIAKDLAHEATHFTEGSKEYTDYVDYMLDTLSTQEGDVVLEDESGSTKLNKYQQSIYDIYKNSTAAGVEGGYKISQETFAELSNGALREKISKGQALNTEERLLLSEVIAKGSEHLLGNETVINDLVERNRGLAKKMLNNIKYAIKVIETAFKGDKAALNELTTYRKAEKLFEKALATAGERYLTKKAVKRAIMTDKQSNAQNGETRYSLKPVEPIKPKSKSWRPTMDTDEALKRFPGLWNVKAEESEVRNPTQIKGTVSTYRKIYDILKKEKFNGTILDASSGLGYGTRAGIDEYGFNVEDIEPYPDASYKPKYTDYSALDKKYDVIISNAVLNVLPQDQRDALVVKMGEMLNDGGRLFINVRGDDVNNLSSNPANVQIGEMEWYVAPTGSYQKGFTKAELAAYLQDALGDGFTVEITTKFGKTAAIITKNPQERIQYSLKIGDERISGDVEQNKNLVALHNLSEQSLLKVLKLGGFPMPSIAITKADMGHTEYGDITVVFGRETIDPQSDGRNKVYERDGWTPTAPKVEYKPNEKVLYKIRKKHHDLAQKVGYDAARPFYNFANDIERQLEFYGGEIGLISSLYEDTDVMNLFLVDTGREYIKPIQNEIRSELSEAEKTYRQSIIDALGKDFLNEWDKLKNDGKKAFINLHKAKIVDALAPIMQGKESIEETKANISQNLSTYALGTVLNKAVNFLKNSGVSVRTETDITATREAILKATPKQEYIAWLENLFGGIEEKTGIYNGTDPYTRSGNRRSFEALHYEYTLENMVRAMSEAGEKGQSSWHGLTLGQLQAKLSKEFKSIGEIRLNADKLTARDEVAHEQFSETARLMLNEITGEMVDQSRYTDDVAYWQALDSAQMVVGEIADNKLFTLEKIAEFMKREYPKSYIYNDSIGNKILGLFAYVQTENNTDYFEAKPRRAVGLDEIKRVLLPSGTSQKLIDALNENGIEYQMYSENESRSSIIEEMDDIKFSRKGGDGKLTAQAKEIIKKALYSSWTPLDYHTMDNEDAVLDDADLTDYAKRIVDLFYSVDPEDPSGTLYDMVADEIAEDILDSAFVEWHHSSSEVEQAEAELKVLNEYRHNINLSHIMGDVQYTYDRRGMLPILGQWHNPKAKDGIDTIVMEINETFHYEYIKEDAAEIDQFEQLVDKVNHANQIIRETRRENLVSRIRRDYGGDEFEIDEVLSDIKDTVRTELIEKLLPQMDLSSENREARVRLEKETREEIEAEQRAIFEKKRAEVEREAKRSIKHIRDEVIEWKARLNELESMIGDTVLDGLPIKRGIRGKLTSENIIDAVYQLIKKSTGDTQTKYIDTLAEYVIERDYMRPLYASPKVQRAYDIAKLKKYLKNVGLPPESYFGDSYKAIAGRWTKKSPKVRSEDFIKAARKAGIEIAEIPSYADGVQAYYEATAAAIIKINEEYGAATREMYNARQRANYSLNKIFTKEERAEIKSRIVEKIKGAVSEGKANLATSLISTYQDTISQQRGLIEEGLEYNKVVNSVLDIAERLKPASTRHYDDKTTLIDSNFEKIIGSLGSLKLRGDIRKASARRIIAEFGTWYTAGNKLLNGDLELSEAESALASTGQSGYLYADIIEAINGFKERVDEKAPLTLDELKDAEIILRAAEHILRNYNIETLNGQQVKLSEVSKDAHTIAAKYVNMHKTSSTIREGIRSYGYNIIDPKTVIADVMGYEDNALSQAFKDVQDGETKALTVQLDLISMVDDFFREHRGYRRRLAKATVTIDGHTIPLTHALSLYMLAQQQASTDGLTQGGWGYRSGRGNYWQDCGKLTMDTAAMRDLFTQADLDFLDVARKFFDRSGEYMYDTDMRLKGYSTVQTENSDYFPIKRYEGDFARSVDQSYMQSIMNASVQNLGVTKQRVKNARRIDVLSILDVMESHARDIGRYTGLAIPIKAFQRIYNCNISADGGVVSLRNTINEKIWSKFNQYVTNLLADIQGITGKRGVGDKAIDAIRGAYAKYQLGANVKVILSQMASFPTAFSYLSLSSMIKGIGHSFSANGVDRHTFTNMDKYCPWAKVRNANSGIVLAESVTDKIGTVGDALTKPIQWTDRLTIGMLWNSCMAEVERRHRNDAEYKYGTDTNMTEAGKLLEQVGRDTQPNYTQSERTALQRSASSLVRMFTMFSAVPTKQISKLYEAFGRERALRYRQHTLKETVSEAERKAAHRFTTKAIVAITVANTVYVLMGELVKFILKKDRKDKDGNEISFGEDFLKDLLSTTAGMFPFIKEIYNVVVQGYDNENYVSSAINELVGSIKDLFESSAAIARGETYKKSDILRPMRDFCYALGQVTGIPVRNIYNLVYGLINRFDSETAYKMNSLFYGTSSYTQDLKSATKKGDADLQRTIIGLMLEDDGMTSTSKAVNEKIRTLYSNGYTVLPRSVRDTVSYNGNTYAMSGRQQQQFRTVYGKANAEVEKLIKSASFNHLSEEIQAKTIKWIFDYHYENGVYQVLGLVPDTKKQLFAETMDSSKFAMAIAACSFVEGEQDRNGNTKPGSKKTAVMRLLNSLSLTRNEKVMILAYLGYSVDEYAVIIKSYISRLGLTKAQQKVFLNFCGV